MTEEVKSLDISHARDILGLAEEVASTGVPRVLTRDGEELAVIRPVPSAGRGQSRSRPARVASPNAWLEGLIGMAESAGPGDVSANIHVYVAQTTHAEGRDRTQQ